MNADKGKRWTIRVHLVKQAVNIFQYKEAVDLVTDEENMTKDEYDEITQKIINCAFIVSNTLGPGFLEKVYENAMTIELQKANLDAKPQFPIKVFYDNICVGDYYADLMVNDEIIIEIKTVRAIEGIQIAQLLNYLKATNKKLGLILNFAKPKVEIKRIVNEL
jgi:GxxExxY protein